MSDPRRARLAGGAGIAFIALLIAAAILNGDAPGSGASHREIVSYLNDHSERVRAEVATLLMAVAGFAFVWFVVHLRELVRPGDDESGRLSAIVVPAGVVLMAMLQAVFALGGAMSEAIEYFDSARPDANLWLVLQGLSYNAMLYAAIPGAHQLPQVEGEPQEGEARERHQERGRDGLAAIAAVGQVGDDLALRRPRAGRVAAQDRRGDEQRDEGDAGAAGQPRAAWIGHGWTSWGDGSVAGDATPAPRPRPPCDLASSPSWWHHDRPGRWPP